MAERRDALYENNGVSLADPVPGCLCIHDI
jgi:hypothetical protein